MISDVKTLTRRQALKAALLLIGGSIATAQMGLFSGRLAAMEKDSQPQFFKADQYSALVRICDLIIPETDTPGALSAGVPGTIDLMLTSWASPEIRERYSEGLDHINELAMEGMSAKFAACPEDQQIDLLQTLDDEAFAEGAPDSFFKELKKMVLFAYYSSEEGATIELKFDRIPGDYRGCVPLKEIGRTWFVPGYANEI